MLKSIRHCVFETNSSSTHSISIYKWTPTIELSIPLNTKLELNGRISCQTEIRDEMGKANYIVAILASIAQQRYDNNWNMDSQEESFEELINNNHFKWLKELIKDKTNTKIVYKSIQKYYPYFETTYDERTNIEDILECDIDNEQEFKTKVTEIIFDKYYVIEDKENEY